MELVAVHKIELVVDSTLKNFVCKIELVVASIEKWKFLQQLRILVPKNFIQKIELVVANKREMEFFSNSFVY